MKFFRNLVLFLVLFTITSMDARTAAKTKPVQPQYEYEPTETIEEPIEQLPAPVKRTTRTTAQKKPAARTIKPSTAKTTTSARKQPVKRQAAAQTKKSTCSKNYPHCRTQTTCKKTICNTNKKSNTGKNYHKTCTK
jgi:hypothetical protein